MKVTLIMNNHEQKMGPMMVYGCLEMGMNSQIAILFIGK